MFDKETITCACSHFYRVRSTSKDPAIGNVKKSRNTAWFRYFFGLFLKNKSSFESFGYRIDGILYKRTRTFSIGGGTTRFLLDAFSGWKCFQDTRYIRNTSFRVHARLFLLFVVFLFPRTMAIGFRNFLKLSRKKLRFERYEFSDRNVVKNLSSYLF